MMLPTNECHRGVDTSRDAAGMASHAAGTLRALVHKTLFENPAGLTVDETCAITGHRRYSLQPRFTQLKDAGAIRDTGARRFNESGARAIVWRATVLDRMESAA